MVFFETEELTGLHFIIHGPFQLTDNRGNIKRDDPWNAELVDAIAAMVADALPMLRDLGMLKRSVLDLLPNATDELPVAFAPILATIVTKFAEEEPHSGSERGVCDNGQQHPRAGGSSRSPRRSWPRGILQ